jgi:hypothetical protein
MKRFIFTLTLTLLAAPLFAQNTANPAVFSRVTFTTGLFPATTNAADIGSNTVKVKDAYIHKVIIGDEATQTNNVMLRHNDADDVNFLLTVAKGDESALASMQMLHLCVSGDCSFPDGRAVDSQPNYTGADFAANSVIFNMPATVTPSADMTKGVTGGYFNISFNGTHAKGGSIVGFAGETYYNSTGNMSGGLTGISAWNGGDPASGTVSIANNNPFYAGGSSNTHVSSTIFNTIYVDRAYSNGGGSIGEMQMIYIEDPAGYVSEGGTISGATYLVKSNLTSGRFNVNGNGTAVLTGLQLDRNGVSKPTCVATPADRGKFWYTAGGAGVKDNVEVCAKDAADVYAWRTIY